MNQLSDTDLVSNFQLNPKPGLTQQAKELGRNLFIRWRRKAPWKWIWRAYDRRRPNITDLRKIYAALATIEQATDELGYFVSVRDMLCRQIDGLIIDGTGRPGIALLQLAEHFRHEVDRHRQSRVKGTIRPEPFSPHPIPTTPRFLDLARIWPETQREKHRFLRDIVGQYPTNGVSQVFRPGSASIAELIDKIQTGAHRGDDRQLVRAAILASVKSFFCGDATPEQQHILINKLPQMVLEQATDREWVSQEIRRRNDHVLKLVGALERTIRV